ncbi:MAG TPA: hypothetical protein VMJ34_11795 [Bryobacteraceae bacterium]|nr:hypothetical protein [Bryobacteraceae bacterium]
MKTVQVAIRDAEYAESICNVLRREGRHTVVLVDQPDLSLEGVIVLDCEHLERIGIAAQEPDRLVLVTRKDPDRLARIWNAGIRHVVFEDDSPNTVQLAVSAAELRQARPATQKDNAGQGAVGAPPRRHSQLRRGSELPILGGNGMNRYRACHYRFPVKGPHEF